MSKKRPGPDSGSTLHRRDWLRMAGAAGLATTISPLSAAPSIGRNRLSWPAPGKRFSVPPIDPVRIGFVGVGGMGSVHVRNLLQIEGVQLRAICDIVQEKVARAQELTVEAGQPKPAGYSRGEYDFVRMCEGEDLDLVFTATPWRWHVPICVTAMKNGKHAATEVPAALTIDECWELVENAEKHGKHCLMMENCNYDRRELMILNMVRKGLLGEIVHAECGYLHDLRAIKFSSEGEGLWRRDHSIRRNGNLYPTHGLGPVAQCMDVNRGDRFDYLVSMSGNSLGLQLYAREHFAADSPQRREKYSLGDVNVTLIRTVKGRTIYLGHDCNLPRPYSRINLVQGTQGLVRGYPNQIHIEGRSPEHRWEPLEEYGQEFEHPLWKTLSRKSKDIGHGGMDFIEDYRLIDCLRKGEPLDMDVYDAASLSVVSELTERSVANGSRPMEFPDFTRGQWKNRPPIGIVTA